MTAVTVAELVTALEARRIHLEVDGPELVIRPAEAVTPRDVSLLKALKPEVMELLRQRERRDWRRVSLWQLDQVLEVSTPAADLPLLIAPGCRVARELRNSDRQAGRVWCVCEIVDLLLTGVSPKDARTIAETKMLFDGTVNAAKRRS